jgi:hypothetical protein
MSNKLVLAEQTKVKNLYCKNISTPVNSDVGNKFKRIYGKLINQSSVNDKNGYREIIKDFMFSKPVIVISQTPNSSAIELFAGISEAMVELKIKVLKTLRSALTPCIVNYALATTPIGGTEKRTYGDMATDIISLCRNTKHDIKLMVKAFSLGSNGQVTIKDFEAVDKLGQECITLYLIDVHNKKQIAMDKQMEEDDLQYRVKQFVEEDKQNQYKNIPSQSQGGYDCIKPCERRATEWPPHPEWGKNVCACPVRKHSYLKGGYYNTVDKCKTELCDR